MTEELTASAQRDLPHGQNYTWTADTAADHCSSADVPVVLVSGDYGTDKSRLIREVGRRCGISFHEVPTTERLDAVLLRRLAVLNDDGISPHEAAERVQAPCLSDLSGTMFLLIHDADLLDEESYEVLELTMRRHQVGIFMTASAPSHLGYRYAWVLENARGLRVHLKPYTVEECRTLLEEMLEAPPTDPLCHYLSRCSGGCPRNLRAIVREGLDEGWLGVVGTRTVMLRSPSWSDVHAAGLFQRQVASELGEQALKLLVRVASEGHSELPVLLEDPGTSAAVFALEEAGLLKITGSSVHINRPSDRYRLLLGSGKEQPLLPRTADNALRICSSGGTIDEEWAEAAAQELLDRGLIEHARCVLDVLPHQDSRALHLEACAHVLEGAPHRAVEHLHEHGASSEHVQNNHSTPPMPLAVLIEGVMLRKPLTGQQCPGEFTGIKHRLDVLDLSSATEYLETVPPPVPDEQQVLAAAVEIALDLYAAAVADDRGRAHAASRMLEDMPPQRIPIVGMLWVLERAGMGRVILLPEEDPWPASWVEGETPERGILRTISCEALLLVRAFLCGAPVQALRSRLEDLWAQFEGGLPRGDVSRQLLEAFDFTVEGDRSEELFGPVGMTVPRIRRAFKDPWVDMLILLGQLTRCPSQELGATLETGLVGKLNMPGLRRAAFRCAILRRATECPPNTLEYLIREGVVCGVEEGVLTVARARLSGNEPEFAQAVKDLADSHPSFRVTSHQDSAPQRHAGSRLRADRMRLLSAREAEVVERIIAGVSVAQTAEALNISRRTVQTHVRNVYGKLGVNSRVELRAELLAGTEVRP